MNTKRPLLVTAQRIWLFAFLFAIPFSTAYIVNTTVAISYINMFSVVFIGLGVVNMLLKTIPYSPVADRRTVGVISLLFAAMAFALLFTDPVRGGIGFWISRLTQPFLVGWFVYHMLAAKVLKIEEIVKALALSLIPLVIGGVLQVAGVIPFQDPGRVTVLYRWPNTFARYVEILLLLSLPYIWFKTGKNRTWFLALWISGLLLLLASLSYNAAVGVIVSGFIFLALLPRQYQKVRVSLMAALILIVTVAAFNAPKLPKWQTSINDSKETRLEFWGVAVQTIKVNFWTGIGIKGWENQYTQLVERYDKNEHLNYASQQPHNVFLDSLLKAGPLGLMAVTLILLWPIIRGYQLFKRQDLEKYGWFGMSALLYGAGMLLFGLIDDPLWSDDTMPLLFIVLFALAYAYAHPKSALKKSES
jgi:O-antigen ligase